MTQFARYLKKSTPILCVLVLLFFAIGLFYIQKKSSTKPPCKNCNILLIDVDILRADALPCYGYFRNTAPNICNFASKSVLFKDNYSSSIWTLPSMFSLVTSLYPPFHQVREAYTNLLPSHLPTLAQILKNQGYKTAFVGEDNLRNGLLNDKNGGLRGYDLVTNDSIENVLANLSKSSEPWFIHYYRADLHMPYLLSDEVKPIDNLPKPQNLPTTRDEFNRRFASYLQKNYSKIFTPKAIEKYSSIIFNQDKNNVFAISDLFYILTKDMATRSDYLIDIWRPIQETYLSSFDKNSPSDIAYIRMIYDSLILNLDKKLGIILNSISNSSLSKNTITVISSDHGEAFGEHGTFEHDLNFHTELYHTPLIIYSPNWTQGVVNRSTSIIDIFPTLMDLTGIEIPKNIQGHSLISYPYKPNFNENEFIYSEDYIGGIILQNRRWLFHLPGGKDIQSNSFLFDKINDPLEATNVSSKYPKLLSSLFNQAMLYRSYNQALKNTGGTIPIYEKIRMNPQKMERLQKEGYF